MRPRPLPLTPAAVPAPPHLCGCACSREEVSAVVAVRRHVHDAGVVVKNVLRAVAVVDVPAFKDCTRVSVCVDIFCTTGRKRCDARGWDARGWGARGWVYHTSHTLQGNDRGHSSAPVDDEDFFCASGLRCPCRDSCVVEIAEAHSGARLGVVAGGPYNGKAAAGLAPHHSSCEGTRRAVGAGTWEGRGRGKSVGFGRDGIGFGRDGFFAVLSIPAMTTNAFLWNAVDDSSLFCSAVLNTAVLQRQAQRKVQQQTRMLHPTSSSTQRKVQQQTRMLHPTS
eukprot:352521-Chlamydomonas_euryale.AAC.1